MAAARARTTRFPQHIREDAFAYYYAGYTREEVVHRLYLEYGSQAPSQATVKRWMEQGPLDSPPPAHGAAGGPAVR